MEAELFYENTVPAVFVRRINRFTAEVLVEGKSETVHVKNTGRLGELLLPGAEVTLERAGKAGRKTAFDLISVYKEGLSWVNIDSLAPNVLMRRQLTGCHFYDIVKPEYKIGESRVDFYMERGEERYLCEVKGCTLAAEGEAGAGLFPDAPTERGVKHLHELAKAAKEGWRCSVDFVIQMNGIEVVRPNEGTQPEFGKAMEEAKKAGVKVRCWGTEVEKDRIRIAGVKEI